MKRLASMLALLALPVLLSPARAQLFGPKEDMTKRPQCTKDYRSTIDMQISAMEKLRHAGPELVGDVCKLIESGSAMVGGELSDQTRARIKSLIGIDIDLPFITKQCRLGQGNLDRELMTELGYLKSEQQRCSADTI